MEVTHQPNRQQQEQQTSRILQNHLQHEATRDTTTRLAHKMTPMASSGVKQKRSMASQMIEALPGLPSSSSQEAKNESLLGDGE